MHTSLIDSLREAILTDLERLVAVAPRAGAALLVFFIGVVVARLVSSGLERVLRRGKLSAIQRDFFRRLALWSIVILTVAVALNVVGLGGVAGGLLAGGGVVAVVLGFAFKEIGENLLAGVFLAFSRPFEVGDIIASGDFQGAVRAIDLRTTHVRAIDGRDIYIPNAQIFNQPLVNYTLDGLRQPRFRIGIDYGDDIGAACGALRAAAATIQEVLETPGPIARVAELGEAFVVVEVAFWVDVPDQASQIPEIQGRVMEACRVALRAAGYTLSNDRKTAIALSAPRGLEVRTAA